MRLFIVSHNRKILADFSSHGQAPVSIQQHWRHIFQFRPFHHMGVTKHPKTVTKSVNLMMPAPGKARSPRLLRFFAAITFVLYPLVWALLRQKIRWP